MAVLYVKIIHDENPGSIKVTIYNGNQELTEVTINPGQNFEQTFENISTGPQQYCLVSLSWADFHNINSGTGSVIAWATADKLTGDTELPGWQIGGTGAFGSITVMFPASS